MMAAHIARRDLLAAFSTPLAWLVIACWTALTNVIFVIFVLHPLHGTPGSDLPLYQATFFAGIFILTLLSPALTMNSFAAEQNQGTMQLLLTAPIRERDLVLGKYLAALGLLAALVATTLAQVATLAVISAIHLPHLVAGYTGILLASSLFAALGVWISLIVDTPVAAYVITFGVIAVLILVSMGQEGTILGSISDNVGLTRRTNHFWEGRIRSGDVAYFVGGTIIFLVMAHAALCARRIHG